MKIAISTPAPRHSKQGNRVTALRWAGILRALGHRVRFGTSGGDLLVALHALKSQDAILRAADEGVPSVVALTGTDVYGALPLTSLDAAWRIVALQPRALDELADHHRRRARVIYQSLAPFTVKPKTDAFHIAVVGHLRPVKDPFRTAEAVRLLPVDSQIHVRHIGRALTPQMERRARDETANNPRYRWVGQLGRRATRAQLSECRALVLSSRAEGGANVVSEAIAGGLPILSTRISGSTGILGDDYPGYFGVGETAELATLLRRLEQDPPFAADLARRVIELRGLFDPQREHASWAKLLAEL